MYNFRYRKLFHLLIIFIPLTYLLFGKWLALALFFPATIIFVFLDFYRNHNPTVKFHFEKIFSSILKPHELQPYQFCGASFAAVAACITFLIFDKEIAVTAFVILAFADPVASIIGTRFPSEPFFEKSKNGSNAFMATSVIALLVCAILFHAHVWFYIFGVFTAIMVTLVEARPSLFDFMFKGHKVTVDDNFLIPISFSVVMGVFQFMWG